MIDYKVFIISYKRAGFVTSDMVFHDAYIVIPESQEPNYRQFEYHNGCTLLPMPDEFDGNVCRKRNWVLNNFGGNVVMVDDDYSCLGITEYHKRRNMKWDEIDGLIKNGFQMCRDLGTVLWGLNMAEDPMWYREYSPFSLLSPILGPFMGFADCPLRFDERLNLKEDYDIFLQVIHKYHKALRFNKYHYIVDHLNKSGGVVSYRTMDREKAQLELMQEKWGKKVIRFDIKKSVNPKIYVPLKGI